MSGREGQQLPSKEAGLFRQVVKFYESKQYKKGLKAADQILKKHPGHGETLAMKGLILCYQEKKEEAYDFVRRGLRADLKSYVCWHVYGLLWRADNNYDEAIKCYKNALRLDKDNLQILRDLALLQVQMRDYAGFIETRQTLLHLKASNRNNWISFAIAHHLNKDYDLAVQVKLKMWLQILAGFESTQEEIPKGEEYEHSEMLLYKVMILEEGGSISEALNQLERSKQDLKDRLGYEETRGRLLLKKGSHQEAEQVYRELLGRNPDNHMYHDSLRQSLGLPPTRRGEVAQALGPEILERLKALYSELEAKYPHSTTPRRIPLDFLEGQEFEAALEKYVRRFLLKGIPSLFSHLKGLYRSPEKVAIIERKFKWLLEGLQKDPRVLPSASTQAEAQEAGEALLWTRVFMARHHDRLGQTERALELVEECLKAQEEEIELYGVKSKVLKHAGDLQGAAAAAIKAQSLDLADRYLNCVAAKALFRAGHLERAEKMAALFTKDSDQPNLLYEMQCMWYEIEFGSACLRRKDYARALKNFTAVTKHFTTFQEDQFDFHNYCVRKMTLRSYISMLRMEDSILQNDFYAKAACGCIETYLELANAPARDKQKLEEEESALAAMSLEDQKKLKLKKKKEAQKKAREQERLVAEAEAAAAREREAAKAGGKKPTEKGRDKDPDPDGAQLAAVEDPLAEAAKLLQNLRQNAGNKLRTHLLSFEVAVRRGKRLLALQAVKRAISLVGKSHPEVHRAIVRFCLLAEAPTASTQNGSKHGESAGTDEVVQEVVSRQTAEILEDSSLEAFQEAFVAESAKLSLTHKAAALETQLLLHPQQRDRSLQAFLDGADIQGAGGHSQADCIGVHKMLADRLSAAEAAERWAEACRAAYPWSAYFEGPAQTQPQALESLLQLSNSVKQSSVVRAQQ